MPRMPRFLGNEKPGHGNSGSLASTLFLLLGAHFRGRAPRLHIKAATTFLEAL